MNRVSYIGPKRRFFQWLLAIVLIGIPFIRSDGRSLVQFDLPNLAFYFGGALFRIEEMHLFWLLVLATLFLFLFLTMALGRIWCGWACPQTAFTDLAEGFARLIGMRVGNHGIKGNLYQQGALHLLYLLIALLAGFSFVWYFVPPDEFFGRLAAASPGFWPLGTGLLLAAVVLVDLFFLRRLFCREFCPYGRFQTVIADSATLTIRALPGELERCLDCAACLRACPMGIDIRDGFQIECINCARCIDACRKVMARQGQKGIIAYTFGTGGRGWRLLLNQRLMLIGLLFLILAAGLVYNVSHRTPVSLKLQRAPALPARLLDDGWSLTFFTVHLRNLSERPLPLRIVAAEIGGKELLLKGPDNLTLRGDGKKSFRLGVVAGNPPPGAKGEIIFTVYAGTRKITESRAYITHVEEE
ncbi:MAG: 4Fe-4S dicluster domain-containing protein [Desulfurivibrionaceae bacterium]|nr:4Fe-4S dicluster domain-containing protein [Desulfurivibrionaceae bacterium]